MNQTNRKRKPDQATLATGNKVVLARFCQTHKITHAQLAVMVGVTSNAVDHWVTGRRDIPYPVRKMLAICDKYSGLVAELSQCRPNV